VRTAKSQALSLALHAVGFGILLFLTSRSLRPRLTLPADPVVLIAPPPLRAARAAPERSGGSNKTALPARRGAPPPKGTRTFIPPKTSPDPKLSMAITVAFDSPFIQIDAASMGDPSSKLLAGDLGNKGWNGIGDSAGGRPGIGPEGSGPPGINSSRRGRKISPPVLIFQVEPEFSEEARKAKYQGTVVLGIEVDTSGHARNLRVLRGMGLGLDEKAIEAVSKWLFRPGAEDGRPVVTSATVEVNFRLL
jgi:protein TonB